MVSSPPINLIGRFGEYFAAIWLNKNGYEIRGYSGLQLALRFENEVGGEPPLPEEEFRRRRIESLTGRIPHLDHDIRLVEISKEAARHRRWISNHKEKLARMRKALEDLKSGKPLSNIEDPEARRTGVAPWRIYGDQDLEAAEAQRFLGSKTDDFLKYDEECFSFSREEGRTNGTTYPDIVAIKGGDYFLVEVKANDASLAPLQRKALEIGKKYGFKPKVLRVKFEAKCEEEAIE